MRIIQFILLGMLVSCAHGFNNHAADAANHASMNAAAGADAANQASMNAATDAANNAAQAGMNAIQPPPPVFFSP